jgi:hypothetical protein
MADEKPTKPKSRLRQRVDQYKDAVKITTLPAPAERRTRVGTGDETLPKIDGRSWEGRRVNEVYNGIISDLGGDDYVTELQDALAKQAASMITIGEGMASQRILGDDAYDVLSHQTIVRTLTTLARSLGTKRIQKPVDELELEDFLVTTEDQDDLSDDS